VSRCVAVTQPADRQILLNLWQLYMQDLSEFRSSIFQSNGRYRDDRMLTYFAYAEHWAFLIKEREEIAGFVLIRKSKPDTYLLGEFFVINKFRRMGIGADAVKEVLATFPGKWEIPFQTENISGANFWRETAARLGYQWVEELRPVENRPDLAKDVWLNFTS